MEKKLHQTDSLYNFYKEKNPNSVLTKTEYVKILKCANKKAGNYLMEGRKLNLGSHLGYLAIKRVKRNFRTKTVDFNETKKLKEQGIDKVVYHTSDHYYRWYWSKVYAKVQNKTAYCFTPTKGANGITRKFAKALREDEFLYLNFLKEL